MHSSTENEAVMREGWPVYVFGGRRLIRPKPGVVFTRYINSYALSTGFEECSPEWRFGRAVCEPRMQLISACNLFSIKLLAHDN